jgi:hypothetical protein
MSVQPREMQKALGVLQEVYGTLVERLTEAVIQDEEQLRDTQFSFAYQEVEDRFGPRIINLSHLINALQNATGRPTVEEFRVETVISGAEEMADEVNKRLRGLRGSTLKSLNLHKMDDGRLLTVLVLARPVYARGAGTDRR